MTCEKCSGTGWEIEFKDGREFAVKCPDCSNANSTKRSLEYAQIPPRYQAKGFEVFHEYHPSQVTALKKAIEYVEAFPSGGKSLLLTGPCGVGKTHLAVAILKAVLTEKKVSGRFVDETEFLRRLHFSYGPDALGTESQVMLPLMNVDLLVWDDLGTGRPTDWAQETIRMVLNYRYTYQKHTVLTSNLALKRDPSSDSRNPEESLEERIGTRLLSRLLEMCEIVEIKGPDVRRKRHSRVHPLEESRLTPSSPGPEGPPDKIHCPKCNGKGVEVQDSKTKGKGLARFEEMSCFCQDCSSYFIARYFPKTMKLEFSA